MHIHVLKKIAVYSLYIIIGLFTISVIFNTQHPILVMPIVFLFFVTVAVLFIYSIFRIKVAKYTKKFDLRAINVCQSKVLKNSYEMHYKPLSPRQKTGQKAYLAYQTAIEQDVTNIATLDPKAKIFSYTHRGMLNWWEPKFKEAGYKMRLVTMKKYPFMYLDFLLDQYMTFGRIRTWKYPKEWYLCIFYK